MANPQMGFAFHFLASTGWTAFDALWYVLPMFKSIRLKPTRVLSGSSWDEGCPL